MTPLQFLRAAAHRLNLSAAAPAVVLAALLCAGPAQAQWKWRDASGRVQFSDLPPPVSVPDKDILQRPGPKTAPAPAATTASAAAGSSTNKPVSDKNERSGLKATSEGEQAQRRKAEEQERTNRQRADEERLAGQRQDNCQRAREAVLTLESGQRVARVNSRGEREVLNDDQRAEEVRRAKAVVASDCR
jgi:Domain of unknown function (DUF4124)